MASSTTSTPLQRTVAMEEDINNFFSSKPINWMFAQVAFPEFIAKDGNPLVEKNFLFRYDGVSTNPKIQLKILPDANARQRPTHLEAFFTIA